MLLALISCSFYSHSLNLKTRRLGVFRKPTRPSLPLKKETFLPLRLSCKERLFSKTYPSFLTLKEGSTSHLGLLPSGKKRKTALRCSEPLRYKVGGPSKVFAKLCGMGPPYYSLLWDRRAVARDGLKIYDQSPRQIVRDGTALL